MPAGSRLPSEVVSEALKFRAFVPIMSLIAGQPTGRSHRTGAGMDRLELLKILTAEATQGELVFPTSASVALCVREALDDPDCELAAAARLIQTEPLLSARVVAVANSAAYNRSGRVVTDVRAAVTLLGFRTVRSLASALVVRQMAGMPASPAHRDLALRLWEHSANVAALAQVIARSITRQDPETALFAGMVHEVGGFYLISRAHDFPGLMDGDLRYWMGEDQEEGESSDRSTPESEIGRAVLKALCVPEPVVAAVEVLWNGYLSFPPTTLGDTLLLADQLTTVGSPLLQGPGRNRQETAGAIDMMLEDETLGHKLESAAAEVASLATALRF
jgi:HD-like signal output (HDOD) protein